MAGRIRVLDAANRTMQRLGYLKALCALVNETETSNLESLGKRFIARVTQRIKVSPPFDDDLVEYARLRLTDSAYKSLRKTILEGTGPAGVELQDIYLADRSLPSSTGKLVEANWRRYPYLGTALELVKKGTYSAMTRSLVLLAETSPAELAAFGELDKANNPLRISAPQAAILLFCLLENDAEVLSPLCLGILGCEHEVFDERQVGGLLPGIVRRVIAEHNKRGLTAEERDRLVVLKKTADSVEKWKDQSYSGGGAREETIRVRLEPLCDLGLLSKPERDRFTYRVEDSLRVLVERSGEAAKIDDFLQARFFSTFAATRQTQVAEATDDEAVEALVKAGEALRSSLGYSPITDVALLAGTRLLTEHSQVLEIGRCFELLKSLQKKDPAFVRFTVDRMGALAHVKFLKNAPGD